LIRPVLELQADLGAVLREGRVMSGEVLQTLNGETILVGVGSHRVPARTGVRMPPGHKFLFQVVREGEVLVLRVLGAGAADESNLLQALRKVMGQDQPLGELLQRLAHVLEALATDPAADAARRLLGKLGSHVFEPGQSGAQLRNRLKEGGLAFEAKLADSALGSLSPARLRTLGAELRSTLLEGLTQGVSPQTASGFGPALRKALVSLLGGEASLESAFARWAAGQPIVEGAEPLSRDLGRLLARAFVRMELGADRMAVLSNLQQAELTSLGRGLHRLLLAALLGVGSGGPSAGGLDLGWTALDLKGQLLQALGGLSAGPAHEAVGRALAGLEAEQLLNLARGKAHEPLHWSLPVPDNGGWTTAHLFFRRAGDEEARHPTVGTPMHRMTLAVEFSHTGPVRADLVAQPGSLAMRILAVRPEVVDRLRSRLADFEQRLAVEGRRVSLIVAAAAEADVRADASATHDISYLRDHHLMDASG
jgi:hypothetical protein